MIFNYNKAHSERRKFYKEHDTNDHTTMLNKNSRVLISVPHGVTQVRLGKNKFKEVGSATLGLMLYENSKANIILKTKNNYDDANFDENSPYKNSVLGIIKKYNIKYVIDLHGLKETREMDINLGTNFGLNIGASSEAFNKLNNMLVRNDFSVTVDQPFKAGVNTVSDFVRYNIGVWSLQIEVNCGITNLELNSKKFKKLIDVLTEFINYLEDKQKDKQN